MATNDYLIEELNGIPLEDRTDKTAVSEEHTRTWSATINSIKASKTAILSNYGNTNGLNINSHRFQDATLTDAYSVPVWRQAYKGKEGNTYTIETPSVDLKGSSFNSGILSYQLTNLSTGDGSTDILDNFDNASLGAFWTSSVGGSGSVTETSGKLQIDSNNNGTTYVESGDILSTDRELIIPFHGGRITNEDGRSGGSSIIITGTSQSDTTIWDGTDNSQSIDFYGFIKIYINGNTLYWNVEGEEKRVAPDSNPGGQRFLSIYDSGEIDITSYTDLKIKFNTNGHTQSSDQTSGFFNLFGIFQQLTTPTNSVDVELSNDGGSNYSNVTSSGFVSFTASDTKLKLRCTGTNAADQTFLLTLGDFQKL